MSAATMALPISARDLHKDQRGAIMLMGLCMACFLIGALWFLIGIGDAIVFRDSMQEVADHAVFTSAVLHAKGMNFISALNLIMLVFIFFHIFLGIVNDILFLACLIPFVDIVACPLFVDAHEVYVTYGNDVMKPACTGLHYAEVVAAYGYPWIGGIKGYTLGSDYGKFGPKQRDLHVLVLSPSLIPGNGLDAVVNKLFKNNKSLQRATSNNGKDAGQKLGLPVQAHPYNDICSHLGKEVVNTIMSFIHLPIPGKVKGWVASALGAGVKFRYCNSLGFEGDFSDLTKGKFNVGGQLGAANGAIDKANTRIDGDNAKLPDGASKAANIPKIDTSVGGGGLAQLDPGLDQWWGKEGPLFPWDATSNGGPWQEVWAININPEFIDKQEHRVGIGSRTWNKTNTADPAFGYFAEAEFYFECKKNWDDEECNDNDNAAFSIQWRARLRRLEFPEIGGLLGSYIGNFVANLQSIGDAVKELRFLGQSLPIGPLVKLVNPIVEGGFKALQKIETAAATKLGGLANPTGLGSYH